MEVGPASGQISDQGGDASLPDCDLNNTYTFTAEGYTLTSQRYGEVRSFQKKKKVKTVPKNKGTWLEVMKIARALKAATVAKQAAEDARFCFV